MADSKDGARGFAKPALVASDQAPSGLDPSGFDPAREWDELSRWQRRYLLATPLQRPTDAGIIAYRAGDMRGGHTFAGFARRQGWLFERARNCYNTALVYRLSADGAAVVRAARDRDAALRRREAAEAEGQHPGPCEDTASPNLPEGDSNAR